MENRKNKYKIITGWAIRWSRAVGRDKLYTQAILPKNARRTNKKIIIRDQGGITIFDKARSTIS